MSVASIQSRLKRIEEIAFKQDSYKWRLNTIQIEYRGKSDDINNNKRYYLKYQNRDLVYDNIDDFYNEYNIYPNKDINPIFIEVVDNNHLQKVLYDANRV